MSSRTPGWIPLIYNTGSVKIVLRNLWITQKNLILDNVLFSVNFLLSVITRVHYFVSLCRNSFPYWKFLHTSAVLLSWHLSELLYLAYQIKVTYVVFIFRPSTKPYIKNRLLFFMSENTLERLLPIISKWAPDTTDVEVRWKFGSSRNRMSFCY
jgi:hypothetical protein